MKSHALFQQYIWLVNTIYKAGKISLEEINRKWLDTDLSEGLPLARSTFNRHKDAIEDMFGISIECDKRDGFKYYIGNAEVLEEDTIQNWMLSTMSVNSVLAESKAVADRILLEQIPSDGDALHIWIDAMKRGVQVIVTYHKYGSDHETQMKIEPTALSSSNAAGMALQTPLRAIFVSLLPSTASRLSNSPTKNSRWLLTSMPKHASKSAMVYSETMTFPCRQCASVPTAMRFTTCATCPCTLQ